MRDARILTIYEGTTGIQAMDLIGRKLLRDQGRAMAELLADLNSFRLELEAANEELKAVASHFGTALKVLEEVTEWFLEAAANDPDLAGSIAVNYLMLTGNLVCAWLMGKAAIAARQHLDAGADDIFYRNKISTSIFFADHILPRSIGLGATIRAGSASVMSIDVESFN
jgi:acyl-CoA dehydrogenase